MNKFQFGRYSENGEVVFSADNNYVNPTSEAETRKQLSYPVATLKDYVNQTVSVQQVNNDDDIAVQLVVTTDKQLKFRTDESAQLQDLTIGQSAAFSFVGMVVSGVTLVSEANLKAIYGSNTSWSKLSDYWISDYHVYGNGKTLGLTNVDPYPESGSPGEFQGYGLRGSGDNAYTGLYGTHVGSSSSGSTAGTVGVGVPTKSQAGSHPENTGLELEVAKYSGGDIKIPVYSWRRIA